MIYPAWASCWRNQFLLLYATALVLCWPVSGANRQDTLLLGACETLAAAGLKLNPLRDFQPLPIPRLSGESHSDAITGVTFETFLPHELWRQEQTEALFQGPLGRITIARVRYPQAVAVQLQKQPRVSRSEWVDAAAAPNPEWSPEELTRWVEGYTGKTVDNQAPKLEGLSAIYPFTRYLFKECGHKLQGFIVSVPRDEKREYVYLHFDMHADADASALDRSLLKCVKTLTVCQPVSTPMAFLVGDKVTNKLPAKGLIPESPERQAIRERLQQETRNLKNWWQLESPHFIITTDLSGTERQLAETIANHAETLRRSMETLIPPPQPIPDPGVIRVFADKKLFVTMMPYDTHDSLGLWLPDKAELYFLAAEMRQTRDMAPNSAFQTPNRELCRQYIGYALNNLNFQTWLIEGLLNFCANADIDQRRKTINYRENEYLATVLSEHLKKAKDINLIDLMTMPAKRFYARDDSINVAVSWGLVYFFHKAAYLYPDCAYETLCKFMFQNPLPANDVNAAGVLKTLGQKVDFKLLQRNFCDFWGNPAKRKRAERRDPFKDSNAPEGKNLPAPPS